LLAERFLGEIHVARNGDARSVGSGVGAVAPGMAPLHSGPCKVERAKGGTIQSERKKGCANVVDEAGKCQLLRIERSARAILCLKNQDAPTMACQFRRCDEPIGARANDQCVQHSCDLEQTTSRTPTGSI
jgi:hypothetical protein